MVNLELYRAFNAVARCGSLTKAAEELFISQPAISQSIRQLENQLGVPLFSRTHKGMELTQGGKMIYKNVSAALRLLDNAESELLQLSTSATGTIRVGATDSIFSNILADKIVEYNRRYPAVKIELLTGTSPETLAQLKDNKCDVGFINLPIEDREVVFKGTVAHLSDIFVAGNRFSALKGEKIELSALQEYPLLMIESNTVARTALDAFLQTVGLTLQPDLEVENWDFMLKLAAKGMGIGCIPREYAKQFLDSGELFEVNVSPALPVRGVGIALPKFLTPPFALKEFINLFV